MRQPEFGRFRGYFAGFPLAAWAVRALPRLAQPGADVQPPPAFRRPSRLSRGLVQLAWTVLGFRFSIFSLAGRKADAA
jgi:hypothetical protein